MLEMTGMIRMLRTTSSVRKVVRSFPELEICSPVISFGEWNEIWEELISIIGYFASRIWSVELECLLFMIE